jgi:hypothetical protein
MEKNCVNITGLASYESQIIEICCEEKNERPEFIKKNGECMRKKYCGEICVARSNCECSVGD